MKTVIAHLETSLQGAEWTEEIEVEDDATDEEINEEVREWAFNIISWGWHFKDEPESK